MKDIYAPGGVGIKRIEHMEEIYDRGCEAVRELIEAAEKYLSVKKELDELEEYYTDGRWLQDLLADRDGKLPENMKRGILTEDAIWDLLSDRDRLLTLLGEISNSREKNKNDL